jgi:hypothetical protein
MKTLLKLIGLLCIAVMALLIGDFIVEYFWPRHRVLCAGGMDV